MWTCVSTLVPRSSSKSPTRANAAFTAAGSCAATACVAASKAWPVCLPFWCKRNTAKISPKSIPTAMSAMPPNTNNLRAPIAENVPTTLAGIVLVAICLFNRRELCVLTSPGNSPYNFEPQRIQRITKDSFLCCVCVLVEILVCCPCLGSARTKRCHYMLGEHVLRLNAFPMLQSAEIGDDRQFADPAFLLERTYLANNLFRRADKANLLINNFVVSQLGQRFQ